MFIGCANTNVIILLRKLIALCSRCEDQVKVFCFSIFESNKVSFVCGIDVAVM
jgi:hypothetical protein